MTLRRHLLLGLIMIMMIMVVMMIMTEDRWTIIRVGVGCENSNLSAKPRLAFCIRFHTNVTIYDIVWPLILCNFGRYLSGYVNEGSRVWGSASRLERGFVHCSFPGIYWARCVIIFMPIAFWWATILELAWLCFLLKIKLNIFLLIERFLLMGSHSPNAFSIKLTIFIFLTRD